MFPKRKQLRLRRYDYSFPGAYYVTICTYDRQCMLGEIVDGKIRLSHFGQIVYECWVDIEKHFKQVELDEYVIMPNHVHGIIMLNSGGRGTAAVPLR